VELRSTGEIKYYFPIINTPECRKCHGSDHSSGVSPISGCTRQLSMSRSEWPISFWEAGYLGDEIHRMIKGLEERFRLSKYVSKITDRLVLQRDAINTDWDRQQLTILFSDRRSSIFRATWINYSQEIKGKTSRINYYVVQQALDENTLTWMA
jgi:hypothetical protein